MAHDARGAAKQRQLQAQKSHANQLPINLYLLSKDFKLRGGFPNRYSAIQREGRHHNQSSISRNSTRWRVLRLGYEVKAIAGRIQAPIGRTAVNIGEMTAALTPTEVA
jgi:hypothetical protein